MLNNNGSLKEKLKESREEYKNTTVTPQMLNVLGICCSFYFLTVWLLINFYVLLDYYSWYFLQNRLFLILFLLVEIIVNYIKCVKIHADIAFCSVCVSNGISQNPPKTPNNFNNYEICDKWKFCLSCQANVPPRSRHCNVCQVCILKSNHHCYLTGRCVGFTTKRRFIVLCFYAVIICFYTAWNIGSYLDKYYIPLNFSSVNILNYVLPVPIITFLFSSKITLFFIFLLINLYISFALTLIALFHFILHVILTISGQTSYEGFHLIRRYQMNQKFNIESVFGKSVFIHFVWPFEMEILGDGFHWPIKN